MNLSFTDDIDIDAPAAAVWAVVADYGRDPEWRSAVETMAPSPPGEVGVGTTTAEIMRMGGRSMHNGGLVTAVDPGRSFSWRTTSGTDAHGSRTVTPLGPDRARVHLELTLVPHGFERLLAPVLRPMVRRMLADDLRRLAALVTAVPAG